MRGLINIEMKTSKWLLSVLQSYESNVKYLPRELSPAIGNDRSPDQIWTKLWNDFFFRENKSLPDNRNSTIEFVIPKSRFPQKYGQGFALEETIQTPDSWIVSTGESKGWHPNKYLLWRSCWKVGIVGIQMPLSILLPSIHPSIHPPSHLNTSSTKTRK